uniref:Uncharacterized protein n=1 Tax=Lankesteria abbotti TaxID=340204 RepID=A0A6T5UN47_9APIC
MWWFVWLLLSLSVWDGSSLDFQCKSDNNECNAFEVSRNDINVFVVTPAGQSAAGAIGVLSGPAMMSFRDVNELCNCTIAVPDIDIHLNCRDAKFFLRQSYQIPENDHEIHFDVKDNSNNDCLQLIMELSLPPPDMVQVMAEKMGVLSHRLLASDPQQAMNQVAASTNIIRNANAKPTHDEVNSALATLMRLDREERICGKTKLIGQLQIIDQAGQSHSILPVKLAMSMTRQMFQEFVVGYTAFGGRVGCYSDVVAAEQMPLIQSQLTRAFANTGEDDMNTPHDSPVAAALKAVANTPWRPRSDEEVIVRLLLIDAAAPPHDTSGECEDANPADLQAALTSAKVTAVFFTSEENRPTYEQMVSQYQMPAVVHSVSTSRHVQMLAVNGLMKSFEQKLKAKCDAHASPEESLA